MYRMRFVIHLIASVCLFNDRFKNFYPCLTSPMVFLYLSIFHSWLHSALCATAPLHCFGNKYIWKGHVLQSLYTSSGPETTPQ